MNSSPLVAQNETPKIQRNAESQPLGGVVVAPRPKSWSYMHRIKWAKSLPVKPGARLTAVCIADHINEQTGSWLLSAAQMADETGQGERTVRRHINDDLRQYFTVQDRPGFMWRFTIPAPLMAVVEPRPIWPDPPANLADVPCKGPGKYVPPPPEAELPAHLTAIKGGHGLKCLRCDHEWPRATGLSHLCAGRQEKPHRTRKNRVRPPRDSDVRSRKIDQARRESKRIESMRFDEEEFLSK